MCLSRRVLILGAAVVLAAAVSLPFAAAQTPIRIGIIQIVSHPALDNARRGFMDALADAGFVEGEKVIYDYQNAQGDISTASAIARKFVDDKVDLIHSIATPTSQAAVNATKTIPIVYSSVTDPVAAGLVASMESSGNNVTGVSDMWPIEEQVRFFVSLVPSIKKMGIIYNSGEVNSVINTDLTEAASMKLGIELIKVTVASSADVLAAAQSLVGRVDAIDVSGDNTVVSAFEAVVKVANDNDIPLFVGDTDSVPRGGLGTLGTNYYEVGRAAGERAAMILGGKKPGEIPSGLAEGFDAYVNMKAARDQGVRIPAEFWDGRDLWISQAAE